MICEACRAALALLHILKLDGLAQSPELVCVNCAYGKVSTTPIGSYQVSYIKGVSHEQG